VRDLTALCCSSGRREKMLALRSCTRVSHNAAERCLSYAYLCAIDMIVSGRTLFESISIYDSFVGCSNDLKGNESKTVTPRHACHSALWDEL